MTLSVCRRESAFLPQKSSKFQRLSATIQEQLRKIKEGKVVVENAVTPYNHLRSFSIYRKKFKKKLKQHSFCIMWPLCPAPFQRLSLELFQRDGEGRPGSLIKTHAVPYMMTRPLGWRRSGVEVGLDGFIKRARVAQRVSPLFAGRARQ